MTLLRWLPVMLLSTAAFPAFAQQMQPTDGRYFPLNQTTPPGTVAQWAEWSGKTAPAYLQPVRVNLPTQGKVTFYTNTPQRIVQLDAPAQAGILVGRLYRLKISEMPEYPGVEFFPSVELFDRLHPPAGQAENFPVEIDLLIEEFDLAVAGNLVTKVIYLEQPDRIPQTLLNAPMRLKTLPPSQNALAEADALGRPMAIVRLGGRTPDPLRPEPSFFGPGGPVQVSQVPIKKPVQPETVEPATPPMPTTSIPESRPSKRTAALPASPPRTTPYFRIEQQFPVR